MGTRAASTAMFWKQRKVPFDGAQARCVRGQGRARCGCVTEPTATVAATVPWDHFSSSQLQCTVQVFGCGTAFHLLSSQRGTNECLNPSSSVLPPLLIPRKTTPAVWGRVCTTSVKTSFSSSAEERSIIILRQEFQKRI